MSAAHEGNVFGVRPAKRHCRAGWTTAFHMSARQVRSVPYLFGDHPTLVREIFYRRDKRLWIAPRSQLVMAAFSGQNRPAPAHARSVEGAAVVLLAVAIVIVATPAGALRQIIFEHAIDHFDRVAHERIVLVANTESHQKKKIPAHDIARRTQAAAVGDLNHRSVGISVRIRRVRIGWSDADVMTRKPLDQLPMRCDR